MGQTREHNPELKISCKPHSLHGQNILVELQFICLVYPPSNGITSQENSAIFFPLINTAEHAYTTYAKSVGKSKFQIEFVHFTYMS